MPRIVLVAVILCHPVAATDCPFGWNPSPASTTCFRVPTERSTSFFHCVDLCKKHKGTPACIGSAKEHDFVMELAANTTTDGLWLGLYQNETGLGPTKGWNRCVAGDAPNFTNWHGFEPNDFAGDQEDCAILVVSDLLGAGSGGQWFDETCDSVYGASLSYSVSCLCARGHASVTFADDLKALEGTSTYSQRLLGRRTAVGFAAATAIALLPTLLLLGRAGWRRLRRGVGAEPLAPQPRPHDQRRRRPSAARPRALLAPRRPGGSCARRESRPLGGGCASALQWDWRGGRYS